MTDLALTADPPATAARINPQPVLPASRAEFRGTASEYFGIWIVNILLTIVTFGIYSAWAKVRRKRYFYGNTVLLDHAFDYHAKGINIFIGRLIVFGMLMIYNAAAVASPIAAIVIWLLIMAALPWLMARSFRFNMRVTSYRNVRFDFTGKAGGAFVAIILGGLVAVLSLGLLAPFASRWLNHYIINNIRYGDRALSGHTTVSALYRAWLLPALLVGGGLAAGGVVLFYIAPMVLEWYNSVDLDEQQRIALIIGSVYLVLIPVLLLYYLAGVIYRVAVRNAVLSAARLDGRHQLVSDLGRGRYIWIILSNTVVVLLTLGLMRPWAAVREWRYVAEHTGIRIDGDVGTVLGGMQASGAATSAEFMDMEGFDFGF